MKRLLLLSMLFVSPLKAQDVDTVRIVHKNYTTVFSKSLKYPLLVEWWNTKDKIGCANPLPRKDKFVPDPMLKAETDLQSDYTRSGLDRGHVAPAADNLCSGKDVAEEAFYFSNMIPQYHGLNAGDWKAGETYSRDMAIQFDSVHVWAGAIGEAKRIGKVAVPRQCWKVIYIVKTKEWYAFVFANDPDQKFGLEAHKVTVSDIEKLTGFKFKN